MSSNGENRGDKKYKYTAKENKAINEYIKGKSKTEAYKAAYNTSRLKSKTLNEYACRFFKKSKIIARIEELEGESTTKAVLTRTECLEGLTQAFYMAMGISSQDIESITRNENGDVLEQIRKSIKAPDLKNLKGIAETLAKMQGWEKQEETKNVPVINIVGVGKSGHKD